MRLFSFRRLAALQASFEVERSVRAPWAQPGGTSLCSHREGEGFPRVAKAQLCASSFKSTFSSFWLSRSWPSWVISERATSQACEEMGEEIELQLLWSGMKMTFCPPEDEVLRLMTQEVLGPMAATAFEHSGALSRWSSVVEDEDQVGQWAPFEVVISWSSSLSESTFSKPLSALSSTLVVCS